MNNAGPLSAAEQAALEAMRAQLHHLSDSERCRVLAAALLHLVPPRLSAALVLGLAEAMLEVPEAPPPARRH